MLCQKHRQKTNSLFTNKNSASTDYLKSNCGSEIWSMKLSGAREGSKEGAGGKGKPLIKNTKNTPAKNTPAKKPLLKIPLLKIPLLKNTPAKKYQK